MSLKKYKFLTGIFLRSYGQRRAERPTHHMSICVEYSEEPNKTSGGRYQSVTTSFEYVLVGTDFALARPVEKKKQESTDMFGRS